MELSEGVESGLPDAATPVRSETILRGIGVMAARLILDQLVQVRVLYPLLTIAAAAVVCEAYERQARARLDRAGPETHATSTVHDPS